MSFSMLYTECLGNILLFLILDLYCQHHLPQRDKVNILAVRVLFFSISMLYTFVPRFPHYAQVLVLIHFFYMIIINKTTIVKYLKHFVVYVIITYGGSTLIATLFALIYVYITPLTSETGGLPVGYLVVTVLFYIYLFLTSHTVLKQLSGYNYSGKYKFYFISFITLIALLLFGINVLYTYSPLEEDNIPARVIQLAIPSIELIALVFIAIFHRLLGLVEENIALGTELSINSLQKDFFERTEDNLRELSQLRHDFKNHLIILQDMANKGNLEKFNEYIEAIQGTIKQTTLINTPSKVLSAILNSKTLDCEQTGVAFSTELNIPLWTLNDYDTVLILGNLLDNAISAAQKCESPKVNLRIYQVESYLDIDCTNNHCEKISYKNGVYYTTKEENKELHGLGLSGVRRAVKKINGALEIDHTEDTFHVLVSFPNYE